VGDFFQGRVQVLDVNKQESTPVPSPSTLLGLVVLGAGAVAGKHKTSAAKSYEFGSREILHH
jgi:CRISPR/Cas system-associated protein Cas5 (RAMP superfamily)